MRIRGPLSPSASPFRPLAKRAGAAAALLLSLMALALPSGASASGLDPQMIPEVGAAQQMAQQITAAALPEAPTAASVAHAVTSAMAANTASSSAPPVSMPAAPAATAAPSPRSPGASAGPAQVAPTQARNRPVLPHVRVRPHAAPGARPVARVHRRGLRVSRSPIPRQIAASSPASSLPARTYVPIAPPSDSTLNEGLIGALLGLAGDTGFLQTMASAGRQFLPDLSSQVVANSAREALGAAQAPAQLTPGPFGDRSLRHAGASDFTRRLGASRPAPRPPDVLSGSAARPPLLGGDPSMGRPLMALSRSREHPRPGRPHRPAVARHTAQQPVEIAPAVLTLFSGGPALAAAGGGASGAAAVVLTALLVLQILQLLSARLSLELVPWRSALLAFRLERPG